ncbi:LIC_10190 family membrane protein [Flavobacterium mesophilum]|uniref:LIC_10190 family membrane protein n=1 Tax=Flavobacterium mesophilum TaxID=3143495 RepID=UPI0031D93FF3
MLLIAISWVYILFTTTNLGIGFDKILNLKNKDFVTTSILGLFFVTILASIWAIFGRINIEFHIFLGILNIFCLLKFRNEIHSLYQSFLANLKQLKNSSKIFLSIISVLILAQCASIPFVIDNESYYIQTIKWLNEYGFVKGLANLHLFLGQNSGWHITQSVFSFSFLYKNFNDLSGFCLLLGNIFAIQKLNEFYQNQNSNYFIIGLFPLFNLFFFQFISAPSPDISVYIFSFVLFFYFLENYKKTTPEIFNLLVILVIFLFYIKNTTIVFTLFPIILFAIHFKTLSGANLVKPIFLSIIVFTLFIVKNMIICGSPIFPSKIFNSVTDYALPDSIQVFYYNELKSYGYFVTTEQYNSLSAGDLFLQWIKLPKLNGLFNKISIILIVIVPPLIYKFKNEKALWSLYFIMVIQLFLLLVTSPQYRFFMNFVLFFSLFVLVCMVKNQKIIKLLLALSIIPVIIALFFPINISKLSNHKSLMEISNFSFENFIFPFKNSKSDTAFKNVQIGNLNYNSPVKNDFFWANGDGNLPCVDKNQIDYFEKYFHIIPQMRTNDLKDGFYSKKLLKNE